MDPFRVEIKNFSSYNVIDIRVMFFAKNEPYQFRFNNCLKNLEKRDFKIVDSAGNTLELHGYIHINPRNWESTYAEISQTKPFIYEIKGEVKEWEEDPSFVDFELFGGVACYLLKKGEKYFIHLQCNDEVSNTIEVQY